MVEAESRGVRQAQTLTKTSLAVKCGIKFKYSFKEEKKETGVGVGMN